jgi:hypothetical protein
MQLRSFRAAWSCRTPRNSQSATVTFPAMQAIVAAP